ncbi:MAG: putative Transposon Ty3-G Gag-Pol polyprotein [Streblomastix strix]|uniref:Putative Transposon Ty3-G Gag-Pol polyprotein n=1 Tax=Streblomastix strix TaxID=222440 RepID=A0A5J4UZ91_9EUKA|nr:MAG: putative Transposon Ty3-G Gag-Pol polyprotein [Streblomastix strix]
MHGLEEVHYLANQMDYATSLDLKSAFHHIAVSTRSMLYLTFNFNNNNYAYKAMPFGTKHSPIFFAEAIESIFRQIRIHSEIKILNYCDDILLIYQDKQTLRTQTMEIMKTLEQFGWTISADNCETQPKQIKTFLGWIWNMREMNIRMSEERKSKMIQVLKDWCNTIYKSKSVKIRQLTTLIGRLNFLRPQIKEASLYLIELDKAKTQALKIGS